MKQRIHISIFLFLLLGTFLKAQEETYDGNPDTSFFTARDLAFNGQHSVARDTLIKVLTKYPEYADVRNLLASTYSWDGRFDTARIHFNKITSSERKNRESWIASIKNELYAKEYYIAMGLANKALIYLPNDAEILKLKEKAKENIHKKKNKKTLRIAEDEERVLKNRIGIANSFDMFDKVYDPMINTSLEYKRETAAGSIIPRINYANRFNSHGVQYEIDFYPKFSKLFYGYINYGYSNATIFPEHRVGAELYSNWPNQMEFSLGMRYLEFADAKATIYTGSVGIYRGNYYFSLRPYITPREKKTGVSGTLLARKYLKDAENYIGLSIAMGFAPELLQLRNNEVLLAETLLFIESQQLLFEYQFTGKRNPNSYRTTIGFTRQELIFDSGNFFLALTAGLTYQVKF